MQAILEIGVIFKDQHQYLLFIIASDNLHDKIINTISFIYFMDSNFINRSHFRLGNHSHY